MSATKITPSRWYYALAGLVVVVGVAGSLWLLFNSFSNLSGGLTQMVVPGEHELDLSKPGTYTVFHEYQSVVGNKVFSTAEGGLPGLKCSLRSQVTGEQIPLSQPTSYMTYSFGSRSGVSVLQFSIDAPRAYVFSAEYSAAKEGPEAVLAVGQGFMQELLVTVLGGLAIMFLAIGGAVAIVVITFLKRRRARYLQTMADHAASLG